MALIKCPECGKEISDKALACPSCGAPSSERARSDRPSESPKPENPDDIAVQRSSQKEIILRKFRAIGTIPGSRPMKRCPFCVQTIPLDATVCKFCTREVNTDEEAEELVLVWMEKVVKEKSDRDMMRKTDHNLIGIVVGIVVAVIIIVVIIIWLGARH
jgi:uncharacterized membrane protein YvbJ